MNFSKQTILASLLLLLTTTANAQNKPIGYWEAHMPYSSSVSVATDGNIIFTGYAGSFATLNTRTGENIPYSKVEGMSDVEVNAVAYDAITNTTIITYKNGNIDLFKDNTFYNIPDLKDKSLSGTKNINAIYTEGGMAYLSTDIGILVIDLDKKNIKESYVFNMNSQQIPIYAFAGSGNYFYASTSTGLFRAPKNSPQLQNFAIWQHVDSTHAFTHMAAMDNKIFVSDSMNLYAYANDTLKQITSSTSRYINHLDTGYGVVWLCETDDTTSYGYIRGIDMDYHAVDSFGTNGHPQQVVQTLDSSVYIADLYYGLHKAINYNNFIAFNPNGPSAPGCFDIYAYNREVWVAHGGYTDRYIPSGNKYGISALANDKWTPYTYQPNILYDSVSDFISILKDPADGTVYAASFHDGLFQLNPDGTSKMIRGSVFDKSTTNTNAYQIAGMALDDNDNLWVTTFTGSRNVLYVKTHDGTWYKYPVNTSASAFPNSGGQLVIDDYGQKWFVSNGGGGVVVYNDNGTIDNTADDQSRQMVSGVGYGNLPNNTTYCLAKDKNGDIWVGTSNGIGIISCGYSVFDGCDAQIPVVQYDQYAGYLFAGENVRTIAVDGANRKWVGTDNGVWLLSPDASKIIYRFTQDNSPIPSNHVQKIAIDPITGDVYIGTELGLVSYHSGATEGGATNNNVTIYPNPIRHGYTGTIAIKGLVNNADVRITDMSGQLVYRTTALGGQAIWNGYDYTGHRPQSGVYLVFITNKDGSQTQVGKMVFIQ